MVLSHRIVHVLWLALLGMVGTGCHGGIAPVVPEDPTPLAKCSVAKDSYSPLITEWPGSEKARLETMLRDRAVVVSYSGCTMQVLDGCRAQGHYDYRRTTISKDTIDITNADELYAKVPLGAVALEAELEAKGRLAIHTTVVGQMRLSDDVLVPATPACEGATHVLNSVSIGAFDMVAGGLVKAGGKVEVGSAGAGAEHRSSESRIRSAGIANRCSEGDENAPHPDCSSPLQVFLVPARHATSLTAALTEARPSPSPTERPTKVETPRPRPRAPIPAEPPATKAVEVHFDVSPEDPTPSNHWSVMTEKGTVLCKLPCVRRVGDESDLRLQLDADRKEDIKVIPVPKEWGYSPGRRVRAEPRLDRTTWVDHIGPAVLTVAGLAGFGVGMGFYSANRADDAPEGEDACGYQQSGARETACNAGIGVGVGSLMVALGGMTWWIWVGGDKSDGDLDVTLMDSPSARLSVVPEGLRLIF